MPFIHPEILACEQTLRNQQSNFSELQEAVQSLHQRLLKSRDEQFVHLFALNLFIDSNARSLDANGKDNIFSQSYVQGKSL